ncbi:MAG: hypothetical protein KDI13_02770 [Alphaproteobacteria bacterium]|nr:hypothetical protein [Alphaproteobacteria bacterium]
MSTSNVFSKMADDSNSENPRPESPIIEFVTSALATPDLRGDLDEPRDPHLHHSNEKSIAGVPQATEALMAARPEFITDSTEALVRCKAVIAELGLEGADITRDIERLEGVLGLRSDVPVYQGKRSADEQAQAITDYLSRLIHLIESEQYARDNTIVVEIPPEDDAFGAPEAPAA